MRRSPHWRLVVATMSLFFAVVTYGEEVRGTAPTSPPSPAVTLERVAQADTLCSGETLKPTTKKARGKTIISERPVILCAYKESDVSWHVVRLLVQYPIPECWKKARTTERNRECGAFPFRKLNPEYDVEYVSGLGIPRLTFAVAHQGEKLKVYRYRHIWFTDRLPQNAHAAKMIASSEWIGYTPYAKDHHDDAHVRAGARFLHSKVTVALGDLRAADVRSRAYPRPLADVILWKHLMSLALNEQMDHDSFTGVGACLSQREAGISDEEEQRRRLCADESARRTTEAIFVEYALNREQSFYFSRSNFKYRGKVEHAYGAMQFTNHQGTYDGVVRRCGAADLIPRFPDGVLELGNAIKAAACLLDVELAALPTPVQELFAANPKVGGIYPVAAYNEGGGARELFRRIKASGVDLSLVSDEALELPRKVFDRSRECGDCRRKGTHRIRTVFNEETYMYIKKYMYVWKFLEELNLDSIASKAPQEPARQ